MAEKLLKLVVALILAVEFMIALFIAKMAKPIYFLYPLFIIVVLALIWRYRNILFDAKWKLVINSCIISIIFAPTVIPYYDLILLVPAHIALFLATSEAVYIPYGIIPMIVVWLLILIRYSDN